jgi:cell division protein FtsW (lipid II flippase)
LAKFKKKKSDPTPNPEDSKKVSINEENNEIPETESADFKPKTPIEPMINQDEKSEKDKKLDKLFWMRVGFAVIGGILATFLFEDIEGEERRWASIIFMIVIFIVTIFIAKGMKMQLPSSDRKKIVTQGIGSYIFIYLFVWILTYTIVHASAVSTGITSPLS